MKKCSFSLLLGSAALLIPQISSATLLAGYSNFAKDISSPTHVADSSATYAATDITAGFSGGGNLYLGPDSSFKYWSQSGLYGGVAGNPVIGTDDNTSVGTNGPNLTFTLESSILTYTLDSFLVEAATGGSPGSFSLSYQKYNGVTPVGSLTSLGGGTSVPVAQGGADAWTSNNISLSDITGIFGQDFDKIVFTLSSGGGGVDNIGILGSLSAIPEPGSMLALGCVVGSGFLLRSRRRSSSVVA